MAASVPCHIGLGSNIRPEENLRGAVQALRAHPALAAVRLSPVYRTPPWGNTNQAEFLNAVASLETTLEPLALLHALQDIEQTLHRERGEHWGPRTMDLDLLLYGGQVVDLPDLQVPHPYLHQRAFVLIPLCDLAPNGVHPTLGQSFRALRDALPTGELEGVTPDSLELA